MLDHPSIAVRWKLPATPVRNLRKIRATLADSVRTLRSIYDFLGLLPVDPIARDVVNENTVGGIPPEQLYDVIGRDLGWDSTP